MASIPSPGWPIIRLGNWFYETIYSQSAPRGRSVAWWLGWFDGVKRQSKAQEAVKASGPHIAAVKMLMAWGGRLKPVEEMDPISSQGKETVNYLPLAADKEIPVSEWDLILTSLLGWCCGRWAKQQLSGRAVDVVIEQMVFAEDRKLPIFRPPESIIEDEIASQGWYMWKDETGGNAAFAMYRRYSVQQWQEADASYRQLDSILGNAQTVLRYASLQEPAIRLQQKLEEYFKNREVVLDKIRSVESALAVMPDALSAREKGVYEALKHDFTVIDKGLYNSLPAGVWDGPAPQTLGALPALAVVGIKAGIAIGLLAVVAVALNELSGVLNNTAWRDIQTKLLEAADADKQRHTEIAEQEITLLNRQALMGAISRQEADAKISAIREDLSRKLLQIDDTYANMIGSGNGAGTGSTVLLAASAVFGLWFIGKKFKAKK